MKSIEEYIELSRSMPNTSDGGSAAYHFDEVVLVKYTNLIKYGIARDGEEQIKNIVNEKRRKGINTPFHLEIKRETVGDENICWVLQERVKGESFTHFSGRYLEVNKLLEQQQVLLSAPESHFDKCISDLCELFNMGLELKEKNIFYDKDEGFIFIDLLKASDVPLNPDSIKDIFMLHRYTQFIYYIPVISSYDKNATEEDKNKLKIFQYKMMFKVFMAMKRVVPNFSQFERWILRSYSKEILENFKTLGYDTEDLSLNEEEYNRFSEMILEIVDNSLYKIISGKYKFWQIKANEIRIDLSMMGLNYTWMYHKLNTRVKEEFNSDYDYRSTCEKDLEKMVMDMFNERLEGLVSDNPYVIEAKNSLQEMKKQRR